MNGRKRVQRSGRNLPVDWLITLCGSCFIDCPSTMYTLADCFCRDLRARRGLLSERKKFTRSTLLRVLHLRPTLELHRYPTLLKLIGCYLLDNFFFAVASSLSLSSPTSGYSKPRSASVSTTAAATTTRVNHLLSAGTTYHGAYFVAVS
jgi:hypothetical protein